MNSVDEGGCSRMVGAGCILNILVYGAEPTRFADRSDVDSQRTRGSRMTPRLLA